MQHIAWPNLFEFKLISQYAAQHDCIVLFCYECNLYESIWSVVLLIVADTQSTQTTIQVVEFWVITGALEKAQYKYWQLKFLNDKLIRVFHSNLRHEPIILKKPPDCEMLSLHKNPKTRPHTKVRSSLQWRCIKLWFAAGKWPISLLVVVLLFQTKLSLLIWRHATRVWKPALVVHLGTTCRRHVWRIMHLHGHWWMSSDIGWVPRSWRLRWCMTIMSGSILIPVVWVTTGTSHWRRWLLPHIWWLSIQHGGIWNCIISASVIVDLKSESNIWSHENQQIKLKFPQSSIRTQIKTRFTHTHTHI